MIPAARRPINGPYLFVLLAFRLNPPTSLVLHFLFQLSKTSHSQSNQLFSMPRSAEQRSRRAAKERERRAATRDRRAAESPETPPSRQARLGSDKAATQKRRHALTLSPASLPSVGTLVIKGAGLGEVKLFLCSKKIFEPM